MQMQNDAVYIQTIVDAARVDVVSFDGTDKLDAGCVRGGRKIIFVFEKI